MTHQQASAVVTVPLETLQQALRNVEEWTSFIDGVTKITKRAHERYVFELCEGREVPAVVRHDPRHHTFSWHAVRGPKFEGCLRLAEIDGRCTRVTLDLTVHPPGFLAGCADLVAHHRAQALLDIQRLQTFAATVPT